MIGKKNTLKSNKKTIETEEIKDSNSKKLKHKKNKDKYRVLIRKTYVYDSLDDEEVEDAIDIYYYYIEPDSIFIYIFDSIIAIFSFYCLYYFPYYLAHDSFFI